MRGLAVAGSAILLVAGAAQGQVVRGVTLSRDSLFVPGVIVTLLDSTGRPVSRALSDDDGKFTLRAPQSGTYRIDARRLSFRPTLDTPIVLNDRTVLSHTLILTGGQIRLDAVRTTAEQRCEVNPDSGTAAFSVWEEARKALRASQLTRLTRAYQVDVTTFVRKQTSRAREARVDSVVRAAMPIRPFTSSPAELLAEKGYVTRVDRGDVFHAPDEDVLLSDSFAATHCLRLLPDSGDASAIRLGFSPVPGRKQSDITGVLAIERATSELRRLDFSYVNIPQTSVIGAPGGEIVFRRLPEGSWLIDEWSIWLPVSELRTDSSYVQVPATRYNQATRQLVETISSRLALQTTGGRVNRVRFGDEIVWMRQ